MFLNDLKPAKGAHKAKQRVGRGIGCGNGKTCGRGHKGQTARSGYSKKIGFEGGQIPLQRRVPKYGFNSITIAKTAEVRLGDLQKLTNEIIDIHALKAANIISPKVLNAKVILSGKLDKPVILQGIQVTKGAKKAIEQLGGRAE